ncbi:MAG: phosphotransferase, partial [Inconstantimicrobium porci]|uniref:phosphotransferase enzyme family protein n=1 Tax=Inconstantimicrobium porci TaxID=2652291 RepID=UPI002A920161
AHSEIQDFLAQGTVSDCETAEFSKLLRYISSDFAELYNMLPRQIIHRDMHGENMIFENEDFKGFIDFDLSQINARIYDPCYMCTAALSTVFDNKELRDKWLYFVKHIIEGYGNIVQLTDDEKKSIKSMMILNEIIMTAFFYKYGYPEIAHTNLQMALYIDKELS